MLKTSLFAAMTIGLLQANDTPAEIKIDSTHTIEVYSGQDHSLTRKDGAYDSKIVNLDKSEKYRLEVKTIDEPELMTWDAAVNAVKELGPGWRLPTIAELRIMYEKRKHIGGFSGEDYWSSKEQDVNSAWIQGFRLGDQDRYNKQSKLKVRAVRSF